MSADHLLYRIENNTAFLTINREKQRNAISAEAVKLFLQYLDAAEKDESVRAVCITGSGDKAFCAGADLGNTMSGDKEAVMGAFQNYADLIKRLASFPKPTIARVNGFCVAGGTGFMLACDIVMASDKAKFGTPEVNVGLFPMMIGALIFRNVLRKKAMEMILLGETLSPQKALEIGMITRIVEHDELDTETDKVLKSLVSKSPIGLMMGKKAFNDVVEKSLAESVDILAERLMAVASTEDAKEGITAFIEKRKPVFKGK